MGSQRDRTEQSAAKCQAGLRYPSRGAADAGRWGQGRNCPKPSACLGRGGRTLSSGAPGIRQWDPRVLRWEGEFSLHCLDLFSSHLQVIITL